MFNVRDGQCVPKLIVVIGISEISLKVKPQILVHGYVRLRAGGKVMNIMRHSHEATGAAYYTTQSCYTCATYIII